MTEHGAAVLLSFVPARNAHVLQDSAQDGDGNKCRATRTAIVHRGACASGGTEVDSGRKSDILKNRKSVIVQGFDSSVVNRYPYIW